MSGLASVTGVAPNIVAPPATSGFFVMTELYARVVGDRAEWAVKQLETADPRDTLAYTQSGVPVVVNIPIAGSQWGTYEIPHDAEGTIQPPYAAFSLSDGPSGGKSRAWTIPGIYVISAGLPDVNVNPVHGFGPFPVPPDSDPLQLDIEGMRTGSGRFHRPRGLSGRLKMRLRRLVR